MNHIEKIKAAIDYIEANLTKKLDLDMVAAAVHYSKHHLQRIFSKSLGLTLHDYLQRRQLTEAAKLLVFSKKSILDIALLSGYESQQAFHGAFCSMYKLPPNAYRENEEFYPLQLKFEFEGSFQMLHKKDNGNWNVVFAAEGDIPRWMALVRLVIDGFPHLHEDEHIAALKARIARNEALLVADAETAVGILLFSRKTGSIEFMGTHPLYRQKGIPQAFLKNLARLEVCSQKGLVERFDSSIGAGTVLMPYAGEFQLTPEEAMVARIPLEKGETTDATAMSYGYIPGII